MVTRGRQLLLLCATSRFGQHGLQESTFRNCYHSETPSGCCTAARTTHGCLATRSGCCAYRCCFYHFGFFKSTVWFWYHDFAFNSSVGSYKRRSFEMHLAASAYTRGLLLCQRLLMLSGDVESDSRRCHVAPEVKVCLHVISRL